MACKPKEDHHAEHETPPRRDRGQAAPGGRADRARNPGRGRDPHDRGYRGRLRDELLDGELFSSLRAVQIVIESWRRHDNTVRPHASLGFPCRPASRGCPVYRARLTAKFSRLTLVRKVIQSFSGG